MRVPEIEIESIKSYSDIIIKNNENSFSDIEIQIQQIYKTFL